ncbi:ParB/RepB/Spo0J family partition protein [Glaciecola petra]|uniref:Probable chromosome-partitioning protein ParB n=1 Tax=Glaciecola petra TaxID=3075602 RepID=A0ABU2ZTW4_9ALTE|nr:ParB/RepB/Spo0J family partition protein [Aestuariibacter sp. P117]MDT0594847.1 ParB/RepB/Spo0J family partition protein [Aestuariibacter sp. P117]
MAPKTKGLGRGLDALLATSKSVADKQTKDANASLGQEVGSAGENELKKIAIEYLQPGKYQPRKDMANEALEELAASIKSQGIIQPIVVRAIGENKYEIIAGERRWRAAQIAELDTVPCLVKDIPDDAAVAIALIENIQREDLNAMEEAQALDRLMVEFNLTHQQVADAVGKSRATVSNLLRLNGLQTSVKTLLEHGDIEMGHARALLAIDGDEQSELAKQVAEQGLTVRQTEALVKKSIEVDKQSPSASKKPDPDVVRLQTRLSETFGTQVRIDHNAKGKGKVVINFSDLAHLDGILAHINLPEQD